MAARLYAGSCAVALLLALASCRDGAAPRTPTAPVSTAPVLVAITLTADEVVAGTALSGELRLSGTAPPSGVLIGLTSDRTEAALPASVAIPGGSTAATFEVQTSAEAGTMTVTIVASAGGIDRSASFRVRARDDGDDPPPGSVLALTASNDDVVGGDDLDGRLTLAEPAPTGGVRVRLTDDSDRVTVPAMVTFAAGATSTVFEILTQPVVEETRARISATIESAPVRARRVASPATLSGSAAFELVLLPSSPVAEADAYIVAEDSSLVVADPGVLANDTDIARGTLSAVLAAGPANGALTLAATGGFTYVPDPDFFGSNTFTYRASNGLNTSTVAVVTVTVSGENDEVVPAADSYTTEEDAILTIPAPGVLASDSDADGDTLTATLVTDVANGTLAFDANGAFVYTPAAHWSGADAFTYQVSDGTVQVGPIAVTIEVTPVNDPPVVLNDVYAATEDIALVVPDSTGVLANDDDVEADAIEATLESAPAHGSVTMVPQGGFTYEPDVDFFGIDTFTYRATDTGGGEAVATVTIEVAGVNDAPVAPGGTFTADEGIVCLPITLPASDVDGDALTFEVLSNPTNGHLFVFDGTKPNNIGDPVSAPAPAPADLCYRPNNRFFHGLDGFTYRASDAEFTTGTATVDITINDISVLSSPSPGPIMLQGDRGEVMFRQVVVTPIATHGR